MLPTCTDNHCWNNACHSRALVELQVSSLVLRQQLWDLHSMMEAISMTIFWTVIVLAINFLRYSIPLHNLFWGQFLQSTAWILTVRIDLADKVTAKQVDTISKILRSALLTLWPCPAAKSPHPKQHSQPGCTGLAHVFPRPRGHFPGFGSGHPERDVRPAEQSSEHSAELTTELANL